jgi:hypothetical protein
MAKPPKVKVDIFLNLRLYEIASCEGHLLDGMLDRELLSYIFGGILSRKKWRSP